MTNEMEIKFKIKTNDVKRADKMMRNIIENMPIENLNLVEEAKITIIQNEIEVSCNVFDEEDDTKI